MRYLPLIVFLPLAVAAAPAGFAPGQWEMMSAPGIATLDGRALGDLPYTASTAPDRVCLSAADVQDPATLLSRTVAQGCTFTRRSVAGGRIDIAGTCAPQAPGLAGGTVRLTGRWTPVSYEVRFTTSNPSENGVMGFSGTMTGKRIGPCPR